MGWVFEMDFTPAAEWFEWDRVSSQMNFPVTHAPCSISLSVTLDVSRLLEKAKYFIPILVT